MPIVEHRSEINDVFSISMFTMIVITYLLVDGQRYRCKYLISTTFQNKSIYRDIKFFLLRHAKPCKQALRRARKKTIICSSLIF